MSSPGNSPRSTRNAPAGYNPAFGSPLHGSIINLNPPHASFTDTEPGQPQKGLPPNANAELVRELRQQPGVVHEDSDDDDVRPANAGLVNAASPTNNSPLSSTPKPPIRVYNSESGCASPEVVPEQKSVAYWVEHYSFVSQSEAAEQAAVNQNNEPPAIEEQKRIAPRAQQVGNASQIDGVPQVEGIAANKEISCCDCITTCLTSLRNLCR